MIETSTLVVALVSGAVGAILAKLIEVQSQGKRDLRSWTLVATADYTTGIHQALLALRNAKDAMLEHGTATAGGEVNIREPGGGKVIEEIRAPLAYAVERVDDAHSRLGRVHILMADTSKGGTSATDAIKSLRRASAALEEWPYPNLAAFAPAFEAANDAHNAFNRAVLASLTGWRTRLRLRLRRRVAS